MRENTSRWVLLTAGSVFFLIATVSIHAQGNTSFQEGWNGVMYSSSAQVPSYGFVDGVGYVKDSRCSGGCDICQIITNALYDYNGNNANGVVIDTRGITSLTCTSADGNPWKNLVNVNPDLSNTVLLPAGTINISASWVLPKNTRLSGEGPNATIIAANFSTGDIIDMGIANSSDCPAGGAGYNCPDTVVEHLQINGNGNTALNGIVNSWGQELNRVNDVAITGVNVGLTVSAFAMNSGPYSNISMTNVAQCLYIGTGTTSQNQNISSTRGVHGLTCATTGSSSVPAIQINGPNNSLEDVYITGGSQQDGVVIASASVANAPSVPFGNVLLNISGSGLKNVIHIESGSGGTPSPSDISILGVSRSAGTNLIQDDVAGTTLTNAYLGMYMLGEPVTQGTNNAVVGYSRFTTSTETGAPTWLVGTAAPSNACAVGDLYSCTSSGCSNTLWECDGGGSWGVVK
jgi:hypothetical protein